MAELLPVSLPPSLRDGDPLDVIQRVLDTEFARLDGRRRELAEAGSAILRLRALEGSADERGCAFEVVPFALTSALVEHFAGMTTGVMRSSILTLDTGPGLEETNVEVAMGRLYEGREQRALYPLSALESERGREWLGRWAEAGEQQRITPHPLTDFVVFDDQAVMVLKEWDDPDGDYVLLREPVLVRAFTTMFDQAFECALPIHNARGAGQDDRRLLELLSGGFKDEAIARYLGWSLRTVRRHVARLMDGYGVATRFQLGAAAARAGALPEPAREAARRSAARLG